MCVVILRTTTKTLKRESQNHNRKTPSEIEECSHKCTTPSAGKRKLRDKDGTRGAPTVAKQNWQHLESAGTWARSLARLSGLRIRPWHNCGSDLIPGLQTPCASGWPKRKKKILVDTHRVILTVIPTGRAAEVAKTVLKVKTKAGGLNRSS